MLSPPTGVLRYLLLLTPSTEASVWSAIPRLLLGRTVSPFLLPTPPLYRQPRQSSSVSLGTSPAVFLPHWLRFFNLFSLGCVTFHCVNTPHQIAEEVWRNFGVITNNATTNVLARNFCAHMHSYLLLYIPKSSLLWLIKMNQWSSLPRGCLFSSFIESLYDSIFVPIDWFQSGLRKHYCPWSNLIITVLSWKGKGKAHPSGLI